MQTTKRKRQIANHTPQNNNRQNANHQPQKANLKTQTQKHKKRQNANRIHQKLIYHGLIGETIVASDLNLDLSCQGIIYLATYYKSTSFKHFGINTNTNLRLTYPEFFLYELHVTVWNWITSRTCNRSMNQRKPNREHSCFNLLNNRYRHYQMFKACNISKMIHAIDQQLKKVCNRVTATAHYGPNAGKRRSLTRK